MNPAYAALVAERYAPAPWWPTPPRTPPAPPADDAGWDNSDTTCARRRRDAVDEAETVGASGWRRPA